MLSDYNTRDHEKPKRGRPTNQAIEERKALPPVELVKVPVDGIRCITCGRAVIPRVRRTAGNTRVVTCPFCPRPMVLTYNVDGKIVAGRYL